MAIEPLAIGVCSWSLQVKNVPELKRLMDGLGTDVVQIACGDPHHASWDEGDNMPAAATAVTVAGLTVGLLLANRERAIAQTRFLEVRQLANKLFDIDALASQLPGNTKTRQLIVDTSLEYLRRLAADARRDPALALELGNAYIQVARVQGIEIGRNLGQVDQAGLSLRAAPRTGRSSYYSLSLLSLAQSVDHR